MDKTYCRCKICGYPLLNTLYNCTECEKRDNNYIFSLYDYRNTFARQILESYKFKYQKELSEVYKEILKKYLSEYDVIIPIPSSAKSLKSRRFDQMVEIVKDLKCSVDVQYIIQNGKYKSVEQKSLNKKERIIASADKFILLDNNLDKNASVLVVDDITTTGSTIINAIKLLKVNGFKNVHGFTFYIQL